MPLHNPVHAIVGCSSLEAMAGFLSRFGFDVDGQGELSAEAARALYGLEDATPEWRLATPGASTGWLRLVKTPHAARAVTTFDRRAFAIDLFTRDIERSLVIAGEAGAEHSKVAEHKFGPMIIKEAEVHGPDGFIITLLQLDARRPSVLDQDPERLHSEVHSFVWNVEDSEKIAAFWQEQAGLKKVTDANFGGTTLSVALGIEEREVKARFMVLTDEADKPVRVQLIEFLGEEGKQVPGFPLAAGLFGLAFEVASLDEAKAALAGVSFGEPITVDSGVCAKSKAVACVAPGHLRFELWQKC
jgi:hypothetical protein